VCNIVQEKEAEDIHPCSRHAIDRTAWEDGKCKDGRENESDEADEQVVGRSGHRYRGLAEGEG